MYSPSIVCSCYGVLGVQVAKPWFHSLPELGVSVALIAESLRAKPLRRASMSSSERSLRSPHSGIAARHRTQPSMIERGGGPLQPPAQGPSSPSSDLPAVAAVLRAARRLRGLVSSPSTPRRDCSSVVVATSGGPGDHSLGEQTTSLPRTPAGGGADMPIAAPPSTLAAQEVQLTAP